MRPETLANAPAAVFDWWLESEDSGYTPSQEDFLDEFGDQFPEWKDAFPDVRQYLWGEVDDSQFISMDDVMKDCGHRIKDFE